MGVIELVDFQLLGTSVLPKTITEMTGVIPDLEQELGELNKRLDLPRSNIWSLQSHIKSDLVADHWHSIEERLVAGNRAKAAIAEIAKTGKAEITIVIRGHHRLPSMRIPPEMSTFAGSLNAWIDIDHLQK